MEKYDELDCRNRRDSDECFWTMLAAASDYSLGGEMPEALAA